MERESGLQKLRNREMWGREKARELGGKGTKAGSRHQGEGGREGGVESRGGKLKWNTTKRKLSVLPFLSLCSF